MILEKSEFVTNKSINIFKVSELTEPGIYQIEIIVFDKRYVRRTIEIEIVEAEDVIGLLVKGSRLYLYIVIGIVAFVFLLLLVIAFMVDSNRKRRKRNV